MVAVMDDFVLSKIEVAKELLFRRQSKRDLTKFCKLVSDIEAARHHRVLIEKLEDIAYGRNDRLMVFMPPGHAKSTYSSVHFPAFYLGVNQKNCIIGASHTQDLAERFSKKARAIVQSTAYHETFGFGIAQDSRAVAAWETERGGEFKAAGVGAGIAGRRSDVGLIDDPIRSREDAESEGVRDRVWEWYLADFRTRLKPNGSICIIQTRWHPDDLSGRILPPDYHGQSGKVVCAGGEVWEVVNFPAICEQNDDILGRKVGEALWPEYYTLEMLLEAKKMQTPRNWSSLYQQRPRPDDANQFDVETFLIDGSPVPYPKFCDTIFAVIDTATKDGAKHDSTAVTYFAYSKYVGNPLIILDYDMVQIEGAILVDWLPSVIERCEDYAKTCGARLGSAGAFIEDKASGAVVIQQARRNGLPVQAIDSPLTMLGKSERAINVSPYCCRGLVKFSEHAYNKRIVHKGRERNQLLFQITNFRVGFDNKSDDLLDTFTYGISLALGDSDGF